MPNLDGSDYSHETWEVTGGKMSYRRQTGERVQLGPGDTFQPTLKQVADGSLENKARKVPGDRGRVPVGMVVSKDIGLRTLEWGHPTALRRALDAEPMLTVEEMEAVGPTGATGYVTADVERALESREART